MDFAIEGVLSMKCEDKKWRLVAYISKSLNKAKRNYEIHNKEMLAIIRCLEAWSGQLGRRKNTSNLQEILSLLSEKLLNYILIFRKF